MSQPPAFPLDTACPHASETQDQCALCAASVCDRCGMPMGNRYWLCHRCIEKMASQQAKTEPGPSWGNHAPVTTGMALVLGAIYLIGAFPLLIHASKPFLDVMKLDLNAVLVQHEYWRLMTANFAHVHLAHLGFNLFALMIFGYLLEAQIGGRMLLAWMLIALLGTDIATLLFAVPNSIGASGIAYGIQTGFIALSAKALIVNRLQGIGTTLRSIIGYVLIMVVANTMQTEQINVYGHWGGAIAGLLCALVYPVHRPLTQRDVTLLVLLGLIGLTGLATIILAPELWVRF